MVVTPAAQPRDPPADDPEAREAIAYLTALGISASFPAPVPLGVRDAERLRWAAGVVRRLVGERAKGG